jgi:3-dehydroquinate synthase
MHVIEQQFQVSVRYPVYFTAAVFEPSNRILRDVVSSGDDVARLVVVVDRGVERAHPGLVAAIAAYCDAHRDTMALAAAVVIVPGGEAVKNDRRHVDRILEAINAAALCRHSYVVAIGGGAVLDAVGLAAALAHRGIRLIRMPTTVLAQDDSGVGVKNGINAFGKKNYIGTFAPPFAVINDSGFLATLSDRDWRSGVTEAIKAALICDAEFFERLEARADALLNRDQAAMEEVVRHSAVLHLRHIATSGDPFEQGSSRPLDFGHWAGHKLEQLTQHRLRHGEAVAIGLALDTTYSYLAGFLPEEDWRRIMNLLVAIGVRIHVPELGDGIEPAACAHPVLEGLADFQEHLGGRLTIMLLKGIGRAFDAHEMRTDLVLRSIATLKRLEAGRAGSSAAAGRAGSSAAAGRAGSSAAAGRAGSSDPADNRSASAKKAS